MNDLREKLVSVALTWEQIFPPELASGSVATGGLTEKNDAPRPLRYCGAHEVDLHPRYRFAGTNTDGDSGRARRTGTFWVSGRAKSAVVYS
jgi:hypothetical protein